VCFLKLGLTSFGGPIAHLGYFRKEFVEHRKWLNDEQFAQLLAISQFLPGPASSQLGFAIGLLRARWFGALLAFIAFTLPSALLLVLFALSLPLMSTEIGMAVIHGLKLVACVIVADAVWGMAKKLCPDLSRRLIATACVIALLLTTSASTALWLIAGAALLGALILTSIPQPKHSVTLSLPYSKGLGVSFLIAFLLLLIGLPLLASEHASVLSVSNSFYQAGALVFGGGHVVLPLLEESVVGSGWLAESTFLAGYGASQAIPGPMFAFAAYLGAALGTGADAWVFAGVALIFMFLPGFLLMLGVLPLWQTIADNASVSRALAGVNAAVVGILAAALYDPILASGVTDYYDLAVVVFVFFLMLKGKISPLITIALCVLLSMLPLLF